MMIKTTMILAIGFRVRSKRGTQFRQWANKNLSEYMIKGFIMDDDRLKNPDGKLDCFDELIKRIKDIRAFEKRFYQKVRDLFSLSSDYDVSDKEVLKNNVNISHTQMERMVGKVYATFDEKRKKQEAINADYQDLEELKQIVERLKSKK